MAVTKPIADLQSQMLNTSEQLDGNKRDSKDYFSRSV